MVFVGKFNHGNHISYLKPLKSQAGFALWLDALESRVGFALEVAFLLRIDVFFDEFQMRIRYGDYAVAFNPFEFFVPPEAGDELGRSLFYLGDNVVGRGHMRHRDEEMHMVVKGFVGDHLPADLLDEPMLDDLPYVELFYRYLGARGYSLAPSRASAGVDHATF